MYQLGNSWIPIGMCRRCFCVVTLSLLAGAVSMSQSGWGPGVRAHARIDRDVSCMYQLF